LGGGSRSGIAPSKPACDSRNDGGSAPTGPSGIKPAERGRPGNNVTIADTFDPRRNSLNFIRLVLAVAVIFSHTIALGGYRNAGNHYVRIGSLGSVAVYGFFGISGYLIAGSAARTGTARYLWQRFLRIFPAFWVCLIVTAFVFGVIGWYHVNTSVVTHCGVSCYVRQPGGPVGYVFNNSWLRINQPQIAHTLPSGTFAAVWNGSLWTLFYEFLCYLLLAVLAVVGILRRRGLFVVVALVAWITEIIITCVPSLNLQFNALHHLDICNLLSFVPVFLAGSLLYLYRDRIPDSGWLAWASLAVVVAGYFLPVGGGIPDLTLTASDLTVVFLAYPLLWLGIHLPLQRVGRKNDYSYGIYIYAYPVQQLLALWGVARWGYWSYSLLAIAATLPLAMASWWAVEKHALKLKRVGSKGPSPRLDEPAPYDRNGTNRSERLSDVMATSEP
jgi:peptidoglycan/LPS O-acetylase OafA/YrhL